MKQIFKYALLLTRTQNVIVPKGSKVIHAGLDPNGTPCIWAEVDPSKPDSKLEVFVVGTGHSIPLNASRHINSFVQGPFVWHIYTNEEN